MSNRLRILRLFWILIFALSLAIIALNWNGFSQIEESPSTDGAPSGLPGDTSTTEPGETDGEFESVEFRDPNRALNLFLATITAAASVGGFLVTTFFSMRDDRRAGALHALELRNLQQELKQRELEIERLKQENAQRSQGG